MQRKEKQLEVWEELCKVFTETKIRYLNKEQAAKFLLDIDDDKDSKALWIHAKNPTLIPFPQKELILQREFFSNDLYKFISEMTNIPRGGNHDKTYTSRGEKDEIIEDIEEEIENLYKETLDFLKEKNDDLYSKEHIDGISWERKLQYIVYFCVFGSFYPAPFNTTQNKNKFRNCENYKERPEIISKIKESLNTDNILIIKSNPGMGKTQVIKEYIHKLLNECSNKNYEVVFLDEECGSVEEMINQSEYIIPPIEISLEQALAEKDENCIVVVECPYLTIEDCKYLLGFQGKDIRFIVATCGIPENYNCIFRVINLKPLAVDQMFDIFKDSIGKRWSLLFGTDEFEYLLNNINYNTLVVVALAKILKKFLNEDEAYIDEKINYIKEKVMGPQQWMVKEAFATRIRINNKGYFGEKSSYSLTHFIRSLIRQFKILDKSGVAELALWVSGKMSVAALNDWCRNSEQINKSMNILIQCGLAEHTGNEEYIYICPFISDAIWVEYAKSSINKEQEKLTLSAYEERITNFLEQVKPESKRKYPYWIYYKAANTLFSRIGSELSIEKQRTFKKKDWKELWGYIKEIIDFFLWCGNAEKAERFNRQLGMFFSKAETKWGDKTFIEKESNKEAGLKEIKRNNAIYIQIINNGMTEEVFSELLDKAEEMKNITSIERAKELLVLLDYIDMIIENTIWLFNDIAVLEENKLIVLKYIIDMRDHLPSDSEHLMEFYYSSFYYIRGRQNLCKGDNASQDYLKKARNFRDNACKSKNYDLFSVKTDLNALAMEIEILLYELTSHLIEEDAFYQQRQKILDRYLCVNKLLDEHFLPLEITCMKIKADILIQLISGDLKKVADGVLVIKEIYKDQIQINNEKYLNSLSAQIQRVEDCFCK